MPPRDIDLNRPVSPLLHDYKPSPSGKPKKSKALQWFAVGLGVPLLAVALMNALGSTTPPQPKAAAPIMSASIDEPIVVPPVNEAALMEEVAALMPEPVPEFDKLVLTVSSGDTMEKLFRKNKLSVGNLMAMVELDQAKTLFRKIKPGDVIEVTHNDGQAISLYSELNLTSALQIAKGEAGFAAEIIERPIEIRKRMGHGVIETSSPPSSGLSPAVSLEFPPLRAGN